MSTTTNTTHLPYWSPTLTEVCQRIREKHPDWYERYQREQAQHTGRPQIWEIWLQYDSGYGEWVKETEKQMICEHNCTLDVSRIDIHDLWRAIEQGQGPTFFEALDERTDRWHDAAFLQAHSDAWQVSGEDDIRAIYTKARQKDQEERKRRSQY